MTNLIIAIIAMGLAAIDTATGSAYALITKTFTSNKFKKGSLLKMLQVFIIIATMPFQYLANKYLSIELPFTYIVLTQFIIQEAASIYENYKKIGGEN